MLITSESGNFVNKKAMKSFFNISICFLLIAFTPFLANAQSEKLVQDIRGVIVDKQTQIPLPGANVALLDISPTIGAISNEDGEFRLSDVPLGRQTIQVSFIGYNSAVIRNLVINSAKETVLYIELEEKVYETGEIIIRANQQKGSALNQMASVSARSFTVEEASRYAGSREDVARMAMNYAGVSGANDQRNDIIIRGNTPSGILWQLDDVEIPNPNHFAATGTTGGPVGMLNNNTLRSSDFYTGAFPAEFTDVFSGVFDLNMREGNNEQYEFLGQVGFNGFELGAEGPISKSDKSSFLVNYRYSTLDLFNKLGIDFGTTGIPRYQDISFKVNFPMKKGKLSWFGLAGKSSISMLDSEENSSDLYAYDGMNLENGSKSLVTGLNYSLSHNDDAYSKFIFSYVYQNNSTDIDTLSEQSIPSPYYQEDNAEDRLSFKYIYNKKFNRRLSSQSGLTIDRLGFNLSTRMIDDGWKELLNQKKSLADGTTLYRAYTQFVYRFSDRFEVKPGLSASYLGLNESFALEPRFGMTWKSGNNSSLNMGYGMHSKVQSMATYNLESWYDNGSTSMTNINLDFTKAHHWVLGYDAMLGDEFRIKAETYYQYLYDIPVEQEPSYFSMVNTGADWGLNTVDSLINAGKGWNYGLELTLEKFYSNNYYFLITTSLFDSKYTGSDNIKRNTAFNNNFVINALLGKEVKLNEKSTLVFDLKVTWAGGKRDTPINLEASENSMDAFPTTYYEDQAYSIQLPNYLKTDVKIGFRKDGKKISQVWEFYIENVTNHDNILYRTYSRSKNKIEDIYQLGFFPLMNYKIYF